MKKFSIILLLAALVLMCSACKKEEEPVCYKPVIYLYPTESAEVSVALELDGEFTFTYPKYKNGWDVTAQPDGTLTDADGKEYNYLFWEGKLDTEYDFSKGFCVKAEDSAEFLEQALEKLGLTRREANEFIVFWLPRLEANKYNLISFQNESYTEAAKLQVTPAPDTTIRVFMAYKALNKAIDIEPQQLVTQTRFGFTVVEWGRVQVK